MTIKDDFLGTARTALALIRSPQVAEHWDKPSALAEFGVSGLVGHIAYQVLPLPDMVAAPLPDEPAVSMMEHYARAAWIGADLDADINVRLRAGGEKIASEGREALCARIESALTGLEQSLGDDNRPVRMPHWGPWSVTLESFLVTRIMELVVHSDDLAVSVGVDTPEFPRPVIETVVDVLSRLALNRHSAMDVVRAFSRKERAPQDITAF